MSPIRLGVIGLTTTPGAWFNIAHLPYLTTTTKYTITALTNSSVASAERAIKNFNLGPSTKAYDSVAEMAADPNVDMVVCSVNIVRHYELIKPALLAGKMAYVEWPLGQSLGQAEELLELAKESDVRTVVGIQGRELPLMRHVQKLIEDGVLGRVISSNVVAEIDAFELESLPEKYKYFGERKVGGSYVEIWFGHFIDVFCMALGEFDTLNATLGNQHPAMDIIGDDGAVVESGFKKDTYDHIFVQGTLASNAVASVAMRVGKPLSGKPAMTWRIFGEKGEFVISSSSFGIQNSPEDLTVTFFRNSGPVKAITVPKDLIDNLPSAARNIARIYEQFHAGSGYPDFQHAVLRHRMIDAVYKSTESGQRIQMV